ncbi:purine-binding chemotaxis protein CheW [Desulfitispora alkaliphila]|uniref:chemotaxis protein CheW n=1 Tax=Desulfitispora alkaliphila TaxID=622674 RepID=UPI003D2433BC
MTENQLVVFQLKTENSTQEFGVNINQVHEINRLTSPTKIPNSPDFVEGVINLRGKVIPIVDIKKKFHMGMIEYNEETRIIVIEVSGQTVGIVVDSVSEVLRISGDAIEPPPTFIGGIGSEYITGVGKLENRLLILLDLDKTFSLGEKERLEKATNYNEKDLAFSS